VSPKLHWEHSETDALSSELRGQYLVDSRFRVRSGAIPTPATTASERHGTAGASVGTGENRPDRGRSGGRPAPGNQGHLGFPLDRWPEQRLWRQLGPCRTAVRGCVEVGVRASAGDHPGLSVRDGDHVREGAT
jgi:hypothetical protein